MTRSAVAWVKPTNDAPPGLSSSPNLVMPTMRHRLGTGLHEDRRGVADRELARVGAQLVDDDLVVRRRRPSLHDVERVELGVAAPVAAERRRALGRVADGLPVLADDLGVPLEVRLGEGDAIDAAHGLERGHVETGPGVVAHLVLDRRLAPDVGVGAFVDVGEHRLERRPDRVGEHEAPGHEGDAEEHGDAGCQHP